MYVGVNHSTIWSHHMIYHQKISFGKIFIQPLLQFFFSIDKEKNVIKKWLNLQLLG